MVMADTDGLCVTLDTPGVPHDGGAYGKPRWFARNMKPLGYVLGWNMLWHRFEMFRKQPNGRLVHEWAFSRDGGFTPQPITEEHSMVFRYLRNRYPTAKQINAGIVQMEKDRAAREAAEEQARFDAMEPVVTGKTDFSLGRRTKHQSIVVPGLRGLPLIN